MYDIPFILLIYILAGFFAGMYLDSFLKLQYPIFTVLFTTIGLIGGIWTLIRKISK